MSEYKPSIFYLSFLLSRTTGRYFTRRLSLCRSCLIFFDVRDSSTRERAERRRVPFETMKYRRRNVLSFYAYVYSFAVGRTAEFNVLAGFTILQIFPRVRWQTARKAKLDDIADSLVIQIYIENTSVRYSQSIAFIRQIEIFILLDFYRISPTSEMLVR